MWADFLIMLGRDYLYHYLNIQLGGINTGWSTSQWPSVSSFLLQIPFLTSELQAAMSFRIISKRKCFFFISYSAENIQTFPHRISESSTRYRGEFTSVHSMRHKESSNRNTYTQHTYTHRNKLHTTNNVDSVLWCWGTEGAHNSWKCSLCVHWAH